jgi:lysophospholipase L1-like esterase
MKRFGVTALLVCVASLAGVLAPAGARSTRKHKPVRPPGLTVGSRYLALGDSVTFGYQESGVVPAPNYDDPASFHGYPEQIGAELHVKVANAACPGETSTSLINQNGQSNSCENTPGAPTIGYRKLFPLHVHYTGSQLQYAVSFLRRHRRVRLVSLMIGANDYFVCAETTADGCAAPAERQRVVTTVSDNVKRILSEIRNKAHYTGQIVIVNYYSINYTVPLSNTITGLLNTTQDNAARPFHVVFADGFGSFERASEKSGGSPCIAGLLTQLGRPGSCGIHPSYAGQALLAQAVVRAIRR